MIICTSPTTAFVTSSLFFCKGQLSSATATCKGANCPWFSKRGDIKAVLNMDSSAASLILSRHVHGRTVPRISRIFFPSLSGFVEAEETHSTLLPALSPVPWPCHGAGSPLRSSRLAAGQRHLPRLLSQSQPACPPQLCSPEGAAGAPKPKRQSVTCRFAKAFLRQLNAIAPCLGVVAEELCSVVFRNFKDKAPTHVS